MDKPQDNARKWRPLIIAKTVPSCTDEEACDIILLLPRMKYDGSLIAYQTRINWRGIVKKARLDLWDREENDPDHAPDMWSTVRYKDGLRYIETNMVAADAFDYLEKGWWEDELYESQMYGNIYTPVTAPSAWTKVTQ